MSGYRPAVGVAVVQEDDVVYAAPLPDGPIVVLEGVAAAIWAAACDGPSESIVDQVATITETSAGDIRSEVESFVDDLLRRGLLERDRG